MAPLFGKGIGPEKTATGSEPAGGNGVTAGDPNAASSEFAAGDSGGGGTDGRLLGITAAVLALGAALGFGLRKLQPQ